MSSKLRYLTASGKISGYGSCEYCSTYSTVLRLIKVTDFELYFWTDRQHEFYTQPFMCCTKCQVMLDRTGVKYTRCHYMIQQETFEKELLESGTIRNILVRKVKTLEEIFPAEINGIYIIPSSELPIRFKKKTNILVRFKNLSVLNYFQYALNEESNLMHIWKDGVTTKFENRCKFWSTKITRILLSLGRMHYQSELLSIWVWTDTRIMSVEFFCGTPVNMEQASPVKILKVI